MSKFEQFLTKVGPLIKALDAPPEKTPEAVLVALRKVPVQKAPAALTPAQFKTHVLHVLKNTPMEGFDFCTELETQNLIFDAAGRGELYGLLHAWEREGLLEATFREVSAEMTKTYHVTTKGIKLLEKNPDLLSRTMNLLSRLKPNTSSAP